MRRNDEESTQLRCRPGILAKVVSSTNRTLIGRTVFVEGWGDYDRWNVTLLGAPAFGLAFESGRPVVGYKTAFRDTSLVPYPVQDAGMEEGFQSARNLVESFSGT